MWYLQWMEYHPCEKFRRDIGKADIRIGWVGQIKSLDVDVI